MPDKTSSVAGILGPPNSSYLLVKERDIMTSRGPRFSKFWAESVPPPPATKLGRHRQLAPNAGIHVSPLCLGAMSIGEKWGPLGMGEMTKEQSFKLLDAFYAAGGNFIDTANNYQDGESEQFIGEWMEARGVRDQMVVATKVGASAVYHLNAYLKRIPRCSTLATGNVVRTYHRRPATWGTT